MTYSTYRHVTGKTVRQHSDFQQAKSGLSSSGWTDSGVIKHPKLLCRVTGISTPITYVVEVNNQSHACMHELRHRDRSSFYIRMMTLFSSPSVQARIIVHISARGRSAHHPHPPQQQHFSKFNLQVSIFPFPDSVIFSFFLAFSCVSSIQPI